jgi:SAM-dependent methyltransferase
MSARTTTYENLLAAGDLAAQTFPGLPLWRHALPFPPSLLMGSTGTYELRDFVIAGHCGAQVVAHYLPAPARVLDIGCGCGKTARFIAQDPRVVSYVGFDVLAASIDCATRFITPATGGRFRFEHANVANGEYNPSGRIAGHDYRFPVEDSSVDVSFAGSLFTHLLEPDAAHYLRETARVLKPAGRAIVSLHIEPAAGFRYSGSEARIDVEPDYFLELATNAGLVLDERLGDLCGQEILVLRRG